MSATTNLQKLEYMTNAKIHFFLSNWWCRMQEHQSANILINDCIIVVAYIQHFIMPYASLAAQAQSSCICGHLDLVFMEMFLNLFAFSTEKLFPSQLLDHTWQSFPCQYQIYSPYSQVGFKWHIKWVCIKSLYLVMETVGVYWNPM